MKVFRDLGVATAVVGLAVGAQAQAWKVDKAHSSVGFTVKHMVITNVNGNFNDFEGLISGFDGKAVGAASVEFTIQAASVDTKNQKRDDHIRSSDFLAADSFPVITFKSTKVVPGEGGKFQIVGDLTIRGVTKPVTFDAKLNGVIAAMGSQRAGFTADARINRQDFGVKWSKALDNGGLVASDEVQLHLEIEAVEQQVQG